jgi:ribosomal protein L33
MTSIAEKFSKPYFNRLQYEQNKNLDHLIDEFNKFYDEYRVIKNSAVKMEDNIKKSLESHVNVIKDYENNIKNNINKLISKKINAVKGELIEIEKIDKENNINKIIIKKYCKNCWNILINNSIYGKIVLINKKYDLLFVLNNTVIQEEFDNFESCEKLLYSL